MLVLVDTIVSQSTVFVAVQIQSLRVMTLTVFV